MGWITAEGTAARYAADVEAALPCMRHRGPDESGVWHDDDVALGFNRLSIIDVEGIPPAAGLPRRRGAAERDRGRTRPVPHRLQRRDLQLPGTTGGAQQGPRDPVHHRGRHRGDRRGLPVWGADAVPRLRGMFVFLIWDVQERVLFGARDPFGIKPLFFAAGARGSFFASEKKASCRCSSPSARAPRRPTPAALQNYLTLQYVPEPASMHRAVRRVESGCWFRMSPGEPVSAQRYFHAAVRRAPDPRGEPPRRRGATRRSPRSCATRWPSTCAPTSPSGRSSPAASTRR